MKKYFWLLILGIVFSLNAFSEITKSISFNERNEKDISIIVNKQPSDSLIKKSKDTIALIEYHIELSDINKNKGLYAVAYEHLWKALLFAKAINDVEKLASIHDELGVLYGIYGKEDKSIKHKQLSLFYLKKGTLKTRSELRGLIKAYYSLAVQYRKANKYDKSLVYLDSCLYVEKKNTLEKINYPYLDAEKGIIFLSKNQLKEGEELLIKAKEVFEQENKHYIIVVYYFLGDLYTKKKDFDKAIYFYEKSLSSMFVYKSHTDFKTDILKKIGALYQWKGELIKAYFYLEESTKISDSLFSMRSKNNSKLFEIKNRYKETIVKKDAQINQQQHILEKKKRIQSRLIFIIAFIIFSIILLMIIFYHQVKIRKLKVEKENAAIKIKHDKEKLNIVLETKRKELTVSALQLIDKDKNIDILLEVLKNDAPNAYRKIKKEIVRGNNDLWESFNLRFTEVNIDFYKCLREKHNALTPTEQKHCALIKLKFDSKEMARLLNISINSVHISRHRIRKKIGLQRDEDLSNYIANI